MDGTLFLDDSVLYLNHEFGVSDKLDEWHKKYYAGELSERDLNIMQMPILKRINYNEALEVLSRGRLMKNIDVGVQRLKEEGELKVAMLTFNPYQLLFESKFGIDCNISKTDEVSPDGRMVKTPKDFPKNKITYLEDHCSKAGMELNQCIHVGEGDNDVPVFEQTGFSVALNARKERVKNAASISLETRDFDKVAKAILNNIQS